MTLTYTPSTQQKDSQEPPPNQAFFTEPSSWKSDGLHFTVEGKSLTVSTVQWERVERSWEMPEPFTAHWQAVAVARVLVLRFNGDRVFRVVDPRGKVVQVFFVKKHLFFLEERQGTENLEEIPAGFDPPMVSEVLNDEIQRKRVFLTLIDPCEVFQKCRQMMTHLQLRILALKHQWYQPFYVHITSDQTLIENQSHFLAWNGERLSYSQSFDARDTNGEEQTDSEGLIASHLFDEYEKFDLYGHTRWIIAFVVESFFQDVLNRPVEDMLQLMEDLPKYLTAWQNRLVKPNDGPNDGEAAQAGRDVLLLTLRFLCPEWVKVDRDLDFAADKVSTRSDQPLEQADIYVCEVDVELTGLAAMRQRRTIALAEPLIQSDVEVLAKETAGNHVWDYEGMQDETIEVTILSRPS